MPKRNYQSIIFDGYTLETVEYIKENLSGTVPVKQKLANVYLPKNDTETKRAWVVGEYGGGGDITDLERWAKAFTSRGYPFFVPDYKDVIGDFNTEEQIKAIIYTACFNRFVHANKGKFGINGNKGFGMGVSAGGLTQWNTNVALNVWNDPDFASPINELYKNAKQSYLGTASMPGGLNPNMNRKIKAGVAPHKVYAGTRDIIFPIADVKESINKMIAVASQSAIREFDTGHSLGNHDAIVADVVLFFSGLMGIKPVQIPT